MQMTIQQKGGLAIKKKLGKKGYQALQRKSVLARKRNAKQRKQGSK